MACSMPGLPVHHQPGVYSNSCPSSHHCHPTISFSAVPFSFCLQSFPASGSLPVSLFFASGGQIIGVSASASVLPMNTQDWYILGWTGWTSLQSKGLSRAFNTSSKASLFRHSAFFKVQLSHPCITIGKTIVLTTQTFVGKKMSLVFNMPSRFVIAFPPRTKHLLILWLQSPSAVILEPSKIACHCFHCFPIYLPWNDRTRCHDLSFSNVEF